MRLDYLGVVVVEIVGDAAAVVIDYGIYALAGLETGIDKDLPQIVDVALLAYVPAFQIDEQDVAVLVNN